MFQNAVRKFTVQSTSTLAVIALLFFSFPACAEVLKFPTIGIQFTPPANWQTLSRADLDANLEGKTFGSDTIDQKVREGLGRFLAMSKLPINAVKYPDVNPGLFMHEYTGRVQDLAAGMEAVKANLAANAAGYKLLDDTSFEKLGAYDAASVRYSYYVTANGIQSVIEEVLWVVPLEATYLTISSGYGQADRSETLSVVRKSLSSLSPFY